VFQGIECDTEKEQVEENNEQKEKEREKRIEAECILTKACFEATIQSEANATQSQEEKDQAKNTASRREREGDEAANPNACREKASRRDE
jgi:hypothetical protein